MTFKSITKAFLQMEDELDLFDQQIDGVYFWERIRFPVCQQVLKRAGLAGQAHTRLERTLVSRSKSALRSLKNVFVKNPYLAQKSEILFLGSPRRKLRDDGKWWDIYCDPIIQHLDGSYTYLESAYLNGHLTPAKTENIRYLDLPLYLAAAGRKFNLVGFSLTGHDRKLLKNIQERITARFNVTINLEEIVKHNLLIRKSVLPVYRGLFEKVSPKLVFVVCSYGKETLVEACKTLGIPVIELQHGVNSPYHLGYSFPGSKRTKRTFPDYLFSFGDFWKTSVEYPISKEQIYSVGYPYLEMEAQMYSGLAKKDQLVFISGSMGKAMSKFAVELSKRENFPLKIVYKLHPGEYARWRKEYPWLARAKIKVIDNDTVPLYQLFAESKIQIGVSSAAIYEGLNFGLRTILLDLPGVEHMEQLIKEQLVRVVSSPEELAKRIREEAVPQIQTERFFKPNSLNNIRQAMDELLSTGTGAGCI